MLQHTERIPKQPPIIAPLVANANRPMWSVMIPVYNCYQFIEETLLSILQQAPDNSIMQIEVIDDASTDGDVEALVKLVGKGRVTYYRQPYNCGSLRNFETCINRAKGHYVHLLHGDDLVVDGFYKAIEALFNEYPNIGMAFTEYQYINSEGKRIWNNEKINGTKGIMKDWLLKICSNNMLQPPAVVVKRSTYEQLGSFYAVHYGEDWEMWARIATKYDVAYTNEVLAKYRIHDRNISSQSLQSGKNINDIATVINIIEGYIPVKFRKKISKKARQNFSEYYARIAHRIYHDLKNKEAAIVQTKGALRLDVNWVSVKEAVKMYMKIIVRYKNIS